MLLDHLKENIPDADFYRLTPKPGTIMNAAVDWQMIANIASVVTIAGAFWTAYEKFIAPCQSKYKNAFLIIDIQLGRNLSIQFFLGRENIDRESFTQDFSEKIHKFKLTSGSEDQEYEKTEIEASSNWTKI
jgi:hypothetical protein